MEGQQVEATVDTEALAALQKSQSSTAGALEGEQASEVDQEALAVLQKAEEQEEAQEEQQQEAEAEEVATEEAAEETATEEATEQTQEESVEDLILLDEEESEEKPFQVPQELSPLVSELGLEEVKSADDLLAKVKEYKAKAAEVETIFADELLKEANELAKQGVNPLEYLGVVSVNYDEIPDEQFLTTYYSTLLPTKEEVEEYIAEMSDKMKKIEASKIRNEYKLQQETQKEAIVLKAKKQKEDFDFGVRKAVESLNAVSKVKVNDQEKAKLLKAMTAWDDKAKATEFQKKYFLDDKGNPDFNKMAQSAAKLELFDKLVGVVEKTSKNQGKKEVINNLSNVVDPKVGKSAQPLVNPRKALSPAEQELERMKREQS